ncbi:MAG: TetR/AcrR family transcriptional regulator [Desulfurivibrionaceae bacterium]|jgi:AcrR family transcriptional regulator
MTSKDSSTARERIIETALNLFYRQGYLATGINQVIAESQVAKATFYAQFPSKEELCIVYLQARHLRWMEWLRMSVESHPAGRARLLGVFSFLQKWMEESDYRGCAFLNIATEVPVCDSRIRAEVIKHKNALQQYLKAIIDDIVAEQAGTDLDPDKLAGMVYVLVEGAIVASQNYHASWPIDAGQEAVAKLLSR